MRTRAESEAAGQRAQSEIEKARGVAEADRAKIEQARREAEAKVAPQPVRPPTAPAGANPYDGDWVVSRSCATFRNLPASSDRWSFAVRQGEFVLEHGTPGLPFYNRVTGRLAADGSLVLTGTGISGAQGTVGQEISARFEGRLDGDHGVLQGRYGRRDCTLTLARVKAEEPRREAEAKAAPPPVRPPTAPAGANPYDGDWVVSRSCAAFRNLPALSDRWSFAVRQGEFVLEHGTLGLPFYNRVTGRPAADGSLVLTGTGISGAQGTAGRQISARFEGRLDAGRGILQGKVGGRECTLTLARAGG
jgi:hypothetical protein